MYKLEQKTKKRKNNSDRIHEMQEKWFKDAVTTTEQVLQSHEPQAETKIRHAFERYLKTQMLREQSTDDAI